MTDPQLPGRRREALGTPGDGARKGPPRISGSVLDRLAEVAFNRPGAGSVRSRREELGDNAIVVEIETDLGFDPEKAMQELVRRVGSSNEGVHKTACLAMILLTHIQRVTTDVFDEVDALSRQLKRLTKENVSLTARVQGVQTQLASERERRRQAESERDQVKRALTQADTAPADAPGGVEELRRQLAAAIEEADVNAALLEQAEAERDLAIETRSRTALELLALQPDTAEFDPSSAPEPVDVPDTFADLIKQAEQACPLLTFTCAADPMAALDQYPQAAAWRRRTAAALRTLAAYAEAKAAVREDGGTVGPQLADLRAYVQSGDTGVAISAAAVAMGESEHLLLNDRLRELRVFAVPPDVDVTGSALMTAHVRIGGPRVPAPRLHFLDDTDRTGQIVIGYIGPHLRNARTN